MTDTENDNIAASQLRFQCLDLAHKIKPGTADITKEAQAFLDFVFANNGPKSGGSMVLVDRKLAEQIAAERTDMVYDPSDDVYRFKPQPDPVKVKPDPVLEPA